MKGDGPSDGITVLLSARRGCQIRGSLRALLGDTHEAVAEHTTSFCGGVGGYRVVNRDMGK